MSRVGTLLELFRSDVDAEDWFERALQWEQSAPQRAIKLYQRALQKEPRHAAAWANLGRLLHEEGDLSAAESCYRLASLSDPAEATYWFNLGVVLQDAHRLAEAAQAYRAALARDSLLTDAYYNLAGVYEALGDECAAVRCLAAFRRLVRCAG